MNIVLRTDETVGVLKYYGAEGITLTDIPYCNARDEKVSVVAKGDRPLGEATHTVTIGVTKDDKQGTGKVIVYNKFCQNDAKWSAVRYDDLVQKTKTKPRHDSTDAQGNLVYEMVGTKGCALSCMAMVARAGGGNIDPGVLANSMREKQALPHGQVKWGFINNVNSVYSTDDDHIVGDGLVYGDKGIDLENSESLDVSELDGSLSSEAMIIAQVYNPTTKNGHWVLVTGKSGNDYSIIDPGCYGDRKNLGGVYQNNIYRYIVYTKR